MSDRLLDGLRAAAGGRRRIARAAVWKALRDAHPLEAAAPDARERLMARLGALAARGELALPAERGRGWERSAAPPIPEWVQLARPVLPPTAVDADAVPWAPELAFVRTTPGVAPYLADALAIQRWLAGGGRARPVVPMRERSVRLFGDEKRLERLVRTPLFGAGRLDLGVLRCRAMAPPLVYEVGTRGRPALVIENHHTWWSFARWNGRSGAYSAIVYGAGGGFGREAVQFLAERAPEWGTTRFEYFGDLDRDGLLIPQRAATRFAEGSAVRLVPAERWYTRLLDCAREVALPRGPPLRVEADLMGWLPPTLRARAAASFEAGARVPQELVGAEVLADESTEVWRDPDLPF